MDLIDKIRALASKIEKQRTSISTEEATKTAFILPFINALGYDIFDPIEVVPEFTADAGIKKGEKVDYALMRDGKPIILVECKKIGEPLESEHESQLYRYYSVTESRIAILTDGALYKFYSDLDESNKLDKKPFFEFNILNFEDSAINELKKFSKTQFNLQEVLTTASELKYTKEIKSILNEQFNAPSEEFVRFFVGKIYDGKLTKNVLDQLTPVVKKALTQFVSERINDRLKSALETTQKESAPVNQEPTPTETTDTLNKVETSEDEIEGYYIVKSILRNYVDPRRIIHRDTQSYFGILLDDNNRKPICRLRFNYSQKYVGIFDKAKSEDKIPIENLNDIYKLSDKLVESVKLYLGESSS